VLFNAMPLPVSLVGWAVTGFGMGMIYASLSVLTLSLSAPHEQGANTSALQLSEALSVTTALAVSGALFALFVESARTPATCCAWPSPSAWRCWPR
jgi:MFS family permease